MSNIDFSFEESESNVEAQDSPDDNNPVITSDNRASVYREGDIRVYRASALGSCIRALVLQGKDYSPAPYPEAILTAFQDGHKWEDRLVDFFRLPVNHYPLLSNWSIFAQQREYEISLGGNRIVRCHIDGIGKHFQGEKSTPNMTLEFKALVSSSIKTIKSKGIEAFPHYAWQISVEMLSTGNPVLLVLLDKDKSNINEPSTYNIQTILFREPPYSRADILRRVLAIEQSISGETLPDCEAETFFCPFYQYHDTKESLVLPVAADILESVVRYKQLDLDIKLLTKERNQLREKVLVPRIDADGSYQVDESYYILRNTAVGRRSVDIDGLLARAEASGIDISDYISYGEPTTSYTVKKF